MTIINTGATLAAAISVAARRLETKKNERDRDLRRVNEYSRELEELKIALEKSEAELRVEEFIMDSLVAEATPNGKNPKCIYPLDATEKGKD